jgi:hypothetical protein
MLIMHLGNLWEYSFFVAVVQLVSVGVLVVAFVDVVVGVDVLF